MMLLFQPSVLGSQVVPLSWDASSDARVTGYRVYYGTASHNYSATIDAGNATSASFAVPPTATGTTYYFAVTAYDALGAESDFSKEAAVVVPSAAASLTSVIRSDGQFGFLVSGVLGCQYAIEASTNLVDWRPVLTNTAPFAFVNTNSVASKMQFYRAVCL